MRQTHWESGAGARWVLLSAAMSVLAVAGCQTYEPVRPQPIRDLTADLLSEYEKTRVEPPLAGNPTPVDTESVTRAVSTATFASRSNPFAMFSEERAFETGIRYRLILSKMPGYAREFQPPDPETPPALQPVEPQPYRRLSGIYMGDTVQAIVEVEGQRERYIVSPGDRVGNTEWFVESIDSEKMILRRSGDKRPNRVVVWLELPPFRPGDAPGGGGQQPAGGGVAGAAAPGGGGMGAPQVGPGG